MIKVLLEPGTPPKLSTIAENFRYSANGQTNASCHISSSPGGGNDSEQKRRSDYIVALEADEVHRHGDGAIAVPVQSLDVVQQVCEEFVASFQHAEGHDVVPPHLLHDLAGQSLCPEIT